MWSASHQMSPISTSGATLSAAKLSSTSTTATATAAGRPSTYDFWHSSIQHLVIVPGYSEAMLVAFNDDNQGPYQSGWLHSIFNAAQRFFPQAKVVASSFDEFIVGVKTYVDAHPEALPVLTQEIGDTWLYGCASDPKKVGISVGLEAAGADARRGASARRVRAPGPLLAGGGALLQLFPPFPVQRRAHVGRRREGVSARHRELDQCDLMGPYSPRWTSTPPSRSADPII